MKLNADGAMSIPAMTLTTDQLDQHLRDLSMQRTRMSPQVPMKPPDGDQKVTLHEVTAMGASRASTGHATVFLRHPGFGWLCFKFEAKDAARLGAFLVGNDNFKPLDLIDPEPPGGKFTKHCVLPANLHELTSRFL